MDVVPGESTSLFDICRYSPAGEVFIVLFHLKDANQKEIDVINRNCSRRGWCRLNDADLGFMRTGSFGNYAFNGYFASKDVRDIVDSSSEEIKIMRDADDHHFPEIRVCFSHALMY